MYPTVIVYPDSKNQKPFLQFCLDIEMSGKWSIAKHTETLLSYYDHLYYLSIHIYTRLLLLLCFLLVGAKLLQKAKVKQIMMDDFSDPESCSVGTHLALFQYEDMKGKEKKSEKPSIELWRYVHVCRITSINTREYY